MEAKFYLCLTCGNIICKVVDSGVTPVCCGSEMMLIEPKHVDSGMEKHLPVVERLDACTLQVTIGALPHPCTKEHHIVMIALKSSDGINIKVIEDKCCTRPVVQFSCRVGDADGVYSYCNIHGMWYLPIDE